MYHGIYTYFLKLHLKNAFKCIDNEFTAPKYSIVLRKPHICIYLLWIDLNKFLSSFI